MSSKIMMIGRSWDGKSGEIVSFKPHLFRNMSFSSSPRKRGSRLHGYHLDFRLRGNDVWKTAYAPQQRSGEFSALRRVSSRYVCLWINIDQFFNIFSFHFLYEWCTLPFSWGGFSIDHQPWAFVSSREAVARRCIYKTWQPQQDKSEENFSWSPLFLMESPDTADGSVRKEAPGWRRRPSFWPRLRGGGCFCCA